MWQAKYFELDQRLSEEELERHCERDAAFSSLIQNKPAVSTMRDLHRLVVELERQIINLKQESIQMQEDLRRLESLVLSSRSPMADPGSEAERFQPLYGASGSSPQWERVPDPTLPTRTATVNPIQYAGPAPHSYPLVSCASPHHARKATYGPASSGFCLEATNLTASVSAGMTLGIRF